MVLDEIALDVQNTAFHLSRISTENTRDAIRTVKMVEQLVS